MSMIINCFVDNLLSCPQPGPSAETRSLMLAVYELLPCASRIPAVINGSVMETSNNTNSSAYDIPETTEERCERIGGEGAYQRHLEAGKEFRDCVVETSVPWSPEAIAEAVVNGSLPDLMKEYCSDPAVKRGCADNSTLVNEVCLGPELAEFIRLAQLAWDTAVHHVCQQDGQSLVTFFSEGGIECRIVQKDAIRKCHADVFDVDMDEWGRQRNYETDEGCRSVTTFINCFMDHMMSCLQPGPAAEARSLLIVLYNLMPCASRIPADINV